MSGKVCPGCGTPTDYVTRDRCPLCGGAYGDEAAVQDREREVKDVDMDELIARAGREDFVAANELLRRILTGG